MGRAGAALSDDGPPRALRVLALACLAVPQALVVAVQGAAPVLLRDAPLLLLVLHPVEPWSLLVAPRVSAGVFVAVVAGVRLPVCVGDYFVGRWYGERALAWSARRSRLLPLLARAFGRARGPLLVLWPGATVSVLAGTTRMQLRRFLPLVAVGVLLSAAVARLLTRVAAGPLVTVSRVVEQNALAVGAVLLVAVVATELLRARRGRSRPDGTSCPVDGGPDPRP